MSIIEFKEHLFTGFDSKISEIPSLKWLPWIGQNYFNTKIVVLGESQYEDGDEWQENNRDATRILIGNRFSGTKGKIFTNVERVLLSSDNPTLEEKNKFWKSVAYWNLVQRLMASIKERPSDKDFDDGWATFLFLVEILRPATCIVLGKGSCGRLGYYLNNNETNWERNIAEFYSNEKIINLSKGDHKLKLIFINHPSGSRGFKYNLWAKLISENEPSLRHLLTNAIN